MKLSPICLFTYNRLDETKKTIEALKNNFLANTSDLYVFSDGPKTSRDEKSIDKVREYLHSINGFKNVTINCSPNNNGLAKSIITGVSKVLKYHDAVIVLEDDLVTSRNFLDFMNQALNFYKDDKNIISISGYTLSLPSLPKNKDYYFGLRASSWGWAIHKNQWDKVDWQVPDYSKFSKSKQQKREFNKGGSDMSRMLKAQMQGKIDSWAIRFCYHQFKNNLKTVFPNASKLISIGFYDNATHTKNGSRFETKLDSGNKTEFVFNKFDKLDTILVKEFANKFSIRSRILSKIKNYF